MLDSGFAAEASPPAATTPAVAVEGLSARDGQTASTDPSEGRSAKEGKVDQAKCLPLNQIEGSLLATATNRRHLLADHRLRGNLLGLHSPYTLPPPSVTSLALQVVSWGAVSCRWTPSKLCIHQQLNGPSHWAIHQKENTSRFGLNVRMHGSHARHTCPAPT